MSDLSQLGHVVQLFGALAVLQRMRAPREDELSPAMRALASEFKARIQGNDTSLKIEGFYCGLPIIVLLTQADENTMNMSMQIKTPVTFQFQAFRGNQPAPPSLDRVESRDPRLSYLKLWSNGGTFAQVALDDLSARNALVQLCVLGSFTVKAGRAGVELSGDIKSQDEAVVLNQAKALRDLAAVFVDSSSIQQNSRRDRDERIKRAILPSLILIVVLSLAGVLSAWKIARESVPTEVEHSSVKPVTLPDWRRMLSSDTDAESLAWVSSHGQRFESTMTANLAGKNKDSGQLDVLVSANEPSAFLLVAHVDGKQVFDRQYPAIAFVVRVKTKDLKLARWRGEIPNVPEDREGFLVVVNRSDLGSAELLLYDGTTLRAYHPQDYSQF